MGEIAYRRAEASTLAKDQEKGAGLRDKDVRVAGRAGTEEEGTILFNHRTMMYPMVLLIGLPA